MSAPSNVPTIGRRRVIGFALGTLGAGALLAACGGSAAAPTAAPAATKPAAAPTTAPASGGAAAGPTTAPASGAAAATKPAGTTNAPSAAAPATSKAPVTLRFTTWWAPLERGLKDASDQFKADFPYVTVAPEMVPSADFVPKQEAALVAGTWGDASISDNGTQVKWMAGGYHLDLTDRVKADGINLPQDYSLMGLEIWEGKVLHMPFDNDPRAIYYNKTAFKAAGVKDPWDDLKGKWTINDMVEAAKKLTKVQNGKTTFYGLQWNYNSYQEFSPLVWMLGGNYASWTDLKYTLTDPAVAKAHQMLYKWAKEDKFLITVEATNELVGPGGVIPFRAGLTGMYHRAAYDVQLMDDVIKDKFEWDAAPLPDLDANTPGIPVTSGNPNYVPAKTRYPDEAYAWLRHLSSTKFQDFAATNHLYVPSNKKSWKTYQTTNTKGKHLESFIRHVYSRRHGFHFYNAGMNAAGTAIRDQIDLVYLDKKKLEDALRDANQKANELVNFGGAKQPFSFTVPKPPVPASELQALGVL
jgi:multiple sugar transport system substrate-binding protein